MTVKHSEGLYVLNANKGRNIIEEDIRGKQTDEIYSQYCEDYKKVIKELNGQTWAKKCTFKEFNMVSNVSDDLVSSHVKWAHDNGLQCVAMIVDSAIVKMKMNRLLRNSNSLVERQAFVSETEADNWLREKGF